jgi:hypothetical protein
MKKYFIYFMLFSVVLLLSFGSAYATKPGEEVNPNGFPSGPHYNLNIHGKKAEFTCPEQEYYMEITACPGDLCGEYELGQLVETCPDDFTCELTNVPIYGNSIFVPENGEDIEIYMQSGKAGGKGNKAEALPQNELWAIDPCAVFDGDGAIIQLPPGEYDVYARALAKPTDNPDMTVTPEVVAAEDEYGSDLVYLGLLTSTGFQTPTETFTRNKGKSTAIPITGLFNWTGTVCYIEMPAGYTGETTTHCCHDYELDGIYDYCCFDEDESGTYEESECSGDLTGFEAVECTEIDTYCNEYTDQWVFNIADFVNYLWKADNNGLKLLQVRFYPRVEE